MQSTRSERNFSLSYSSTVLIKGKEIERLKNCNGETASGFALLACRFTIRGMGMDSPIDTFGMSKESDRYFFIVSKSLDNIFASDNTRSI